MDVINKILGKKIKKDKTSRNEFTMLGDDVNVDPNVYVPEKYNIVSSIGDDVTMQDSAGNYVRAKKQQLKRVDPWQKI
jgi:hypothetical protein